MTLLKLPVILLLSMIISNCSPTIPNVEVCITLPTYTGYCKYTLSDDERIIPPTQWRAEQAGRISMTPEAFGEYQKFIEKVCIRQKCTTEQQKMHTMFKDSVLKFKKGMRNDR